MSRILLVDDERKILKLLSDYFADAGYAVSTAETAKTALDLFRRSIFDLVITDVVLQDRSGLELLREMKEINPAVQVIVITAYGSVSDAVAAMKAGAFDYILKPFELEALLLLVQRALETSLIKEEIQYLKQQAIPTNWAERLVGRSPAILEIKRLIPMVAASKTTILLQGETGTGKEVVAEAIHQASEERDRPLIKINCPAIPRDLLESELFGHVKGAFSGAIAPKKGKFELAHRSTIFLDEVGELPWELQAKLLRVLQEKGFERVGGIEQIQVDVRVIAATNTDLKKKVQTGTFREDLFFRLNVMPIHIPPLRERKEDLPDLALYLLACIRSRFNKRLEGISAEAMEALKRYDWPGNVRELANVLERAALLCSGRTISRKDLPSELSLDASSVTKPEAGQLHEALNQLRRQYILSALQKTGWRKKEAALLLGLSPRAFSYYIRKYCLDRERGQENEGGSE
ncbi:MAG: sigma-54 dependent transcriptional regulator [candidate division NC10 bacterium]|nr:sigma-54 dependent transcriptional regulator [candidate division NC10 bacterium]